MAQTTKRALEASLKKLLLRKPLNKITINDITEDCGVNRMTFYYHFKDIYDLVDWILVEDATEALEGESVMTIAILAHDSRKELALQFCTAYSGILSRNTVIATGTTGRMLTQATGLPVHCYLSGKLGGIQQISARVACDEVDLVLFFRDPLKAENGSSEQNLLRLCDMHSVPISTNIATAEVLLRGLDQGDLDYREGIHPDIVEPLPVHRAVC